MLKAFTSLYICFLCNEFLKNSVRSYEYKYEIWKILMKIKYIMIKIITFID